MAINGLSLVLNYKRTNTYALNVLAGALDGAFDAPELEIVFAKNPEALVAAISNALAERRKAVVGWSFCSPQFTECASELRMIRQQTGAAPVVHLAGGVHATAEPEETLRAGFDLAAVGEGERLIIDFVSRLIQGDDSRETKGI
ncbi:MAG: TIGR04013 family B12-binding domain/radical SAM domain-containing protein, partial [Anaerolineales bacterium]